MQNLRFKFQDNFQKYRRSKDISYEELSRICNFNRGYLKDLEDGLQTPDLDGLERLSEALGVEPEKLLL